MSDKYIGKSYTCPQNIGGHYFIVDFIADSNMLVREKCRFCNHKKIHNVTSQKR
jgi:hypothetical protein